MAQKRFAKLIDEHYIEFAPKNKGNIFNYDLDEDLMRADGYKLFVEGTKEPGKKYHEHFEETDDTITRVYTEFTPEEYAQEERQRIDQLILTPSDVERALYYGLEMDFEDLKALIAVRAPQVDIKAIGIEFRAKDFYRGALDKEGNRLVDMIGLLLGLTTEELDYLFEHKELPQEAIDRVKPIIHSILHPVEPTEPEEDPTEPEEDPTEPEE